MVLKGAGTRFEKKCHERKENLPEVSLPNLTARLNSVKACPNHIKF